MQQSHSNYKIIRKIIKTINETKELVKIRLTLWQNMSKTIEEFQKRLERFKGE